MKDTRIEQLELTIEEAKKSVELMSSLERLRKNKDFKTVIEKELLENYALNLVYLLSNPAMQTEEKQLDIKKDLEMIGRVRQFFTSIYQNSAIAEKAIEDSSYAIDELRAMGEGE